MLSVVHYSQFVMNKDSAESFIRQELQTKRKPRPKSGFRLFSFLLRVVLKRGRPDKRCFAKSRLVMHHA